MTPRLLTSGWLFILATARTDKGADDSGSEDADTDTDSDIAIAGPYTDSWGGDHGLGQEPGQNRGWSPSCVSSFMRRPSGAEAGGEGLLGQARTGGEEPVFPPKKKNGRGHKDGLVRPYDRGRDHEISSVLWAQYGGTSNFDISQYDSDTMYAIAQNDADSAYFPELWSRFGWSWDASDDLWYCSTACDGATEDEDLATARADDSRPLLGWAAILGTAGVSAGCGPAPDPEDRGEDAAYDKGAGFGQDELPNIVLGPPEGGDGAGSHDVLTLGTDGVIVLAFDAFDLADLGIARARYVRIRDGGAKGSGGFDLDAIAVVNGGELSR